MSYDPRQVNLERMLETLHEVGYDVPSAEASLLVGGMTCASCVAHVEKALTGLEGVTGATVNLGLGLARVVRARPHRPRAMTRAVRDVGYEAEVQDEGASLLDREREARQEELRKQKRDLWFTLPIAALVMIGTFRDMWFFPSVVPSFLGNPFVLGLLATPVVFGPGRQFFIDSWRGLRLAATPADNGTGQMYGEHHATMAQTGELGKDMNPGHHRGMSGWDMPAMRQS